MPIHPDHVGGMLTATGDLIFAHAQYYIWREEWDFWSSDERSSIQPPSFVSMARDNVTPVLHRLTQIEPETEILPGIRALPTPGHTPGHFSLHIESDGQQLLHFSDAAVHPLHMRYPENPLSFDIEPEKALKSKRQILDRAAQSGALVFGHHFPHSPAWDISKK